MTRLVVLFVLSAAVAQAAPPVKREAAVAKAKAAIAPFKKSLKEALTQALAKSPEAAIEVCAQQAPALAKAASSKDVEVGRTTFRLRNPANAPRPWLASVLNELAREPSGSEASRVVELPNGKTGYAEAIWTAPMCLTCHGERLAPEVDAKLKALYPADGARGFKVGDFRGVFWAEVAAQ